VIKPPIDGREGSGNGPAIAPEYEEFALRKCSQQRGDASIVCRSLEEEYVTTLASLNLGKEAAKAVEGDGIRGRQVLGEGQPAISVK
jgi:hypothetical protein